MAGTISIFPSLTSESNWERGLSNDSFRINKSPSLLPTKWGKRGKSSTGNETRCRKKRTHANYERMRTFFLEYSGYFSRNYTHKGEMSIWLNDGKRTDDLRKEFRSYLSVDMLLCFTQASRGKAQTFKKNKRTQVRTWKERKKE